MKKLIVVIPAFNEAERIKNTIKSVKGISEDIKKIGFDLLVYVVDDGSQDKTMSIAIEAKADRVMRHKVNRGLGAAVRTGMVAARTDGADIVVKFDADLQHDPYDIKILIEPILNDEADLVYGHRFEKLQYKMPFVRKIGNKIFVRLMRFLTDWPITDSQPGIFAADRSYLEVFRIPGDYNYTQQILLDAYHKGMRFAQKNVSFRKRETGNSFISFRYPFKVLPQIFWVIVGLKPMKIFGPLGIVFLLIALGVSGFEIINWLFGVAEKPIEHVNAVMGSMILGLHILSLGIIAELIIQNNRRE